MASFDTLLQLKDCTVRFGTPESEYEGIIKKVFPAADMVIIGKSILLPNRRKGVLHLRSGEFLNLRVISRPDNSNAKSVEKEILPVYQKTFAEKLFDLDGSSDIEDEEDADQADYKMKVAPNLSKFVPSDFEIIDAFNRDFDLAIDHIKKQDAIGVSLEGIKISRSALGKQAFKKGIKSILENARIQKILHDSRLASDCLYHKYGIHLVNVFDTQVADFIVMMQMAEKNKIDGRVNTLDACLNYYLEVPDEYLYGPAILENYESSLNFHALRPLKHEIQDVLIKNVMYLHMLKRELELALLTPLRRATDVYLNCIQKLKEKELLLVPHKPDELPLDMHLEGIQIFRYREFEYMCRTTTSGPPYRDIHNPIQNYLHYCGEYKGGQRRDIGSIVNKHGNQSSGISSEINNKMNGDHRKPVSSLKSVMNSNNLNRNTDCIIENIDCAEYKRNQRKDIDSVVNNHASQNSPGISSEINDKINSDHQKPVSSLKSVSNSSDSLNAHDVDHSETVDSEKNCDTFISNNSIVKSVGSHSNESVNANNSMALGLKRVLEYYRNSQKTPIVDSSNERTSNSENTTVNTSEVVRNSSNLKPGCNLSDKSVTSQIQESSTVIEKKSQNKMLELTLKNYPKAASNSTNNSSAISKPSNKKDVTEINNTVQKTEVSQIDYSNVKKDKDFSDSDLKALEDRVRARGAALRNRKMEHSPSNCASRAIPVFRRKENNLVRETPGFSGNKEHASEEVLISYSETLDKPSQFVAKVSHNPVTTRLVDLYKKAGDRNNLWPEESSPSHSKISCSQIDDCTQSYDIWSGIRAELPCRPIDEKLRSRLIPAGMAGC